MACRVSGLCRTCDVPHFQTEVGMEKYKLDSPLCRAEITMDYLPTLVADNFKTPIYYASVLDKTNGREHSISPYTLSFEEAKQFVERSVRAIEYMADKGVAIDDI